MPSYDPKANRPRLVPVESSDGAPVDALLGPADATPPAPAADSDAPAPAPQRLAVVPDPPVDEAATAAVAPSVRPAPTVSEVATPAPPSSSAGRRALAAGAVAAGVLACFVAWRGFARRRADG